ncbi:MAG: ABC transporter ATP-binding protein [Spirochaetia bacterium]|jgi:oligopeptide/dipeptide ABC transporter ATP-binding protein|nr:ABC transporter ATP-binding protein [Spirochaetia bacterium]
MIIGTEPVLSVRNLSTRFMTSSGTVKAVDGVSFDVRKGEIFGIVGESGSGKSVTNLSILRLIPMPPGQIAEGEIMLHGKNLLAANEHELQMVRGGSISMIFQDPMTSLNPLLRVSLQIAEALELHHGLLRKEAEKKAVELLKAVGIPDAERRAQEYPHQFSGGMRQRVMIAMAIGCNPDLLIADEPTTALDVTIQAQILDLIRRLSDTRTMSVILVTHDLGVVAGMCDTVAVMYAGKIVEQASVDPLFREPKHPYTQGLLASVPRIDRAWSERLYSIPGAPPNLVDLPPGCAFAPRCEHAMPICSQSYPPHIEMDDGSGNKRTVRCWLHADNVPGVHR